MDAISGSTESQTIWPFGISSGPSHHPSALELRMRKAGIQWTPNWQLLYDNDYSIFGLAYVRRCGCAPPIYLLAPIAPQFVAGATDDEILGFVRVMQSGKPNDQQAAIDAAIEKSLVPATQPGG
jgi:hypothetical protein